MAYEPLYHVREVATIKLCSVCFCKAISARSSNISLLFLMKQLFRSRLLDQCKGEIIIAIFHLISSERSWYILLNIAHLDTSVVIQNSFYDLKRNA